MVDAESALFKAKSAYFKCCQAGVRLREDLTIAQASLDESQASLMAAATAPSLPPTGTSVNGGSSAPASASFTTAASGSTENGQDGSTTYSSSVSAGTAYTPPSTIDPALMNAAVKYKAKVEKLERQLGDNDKKVGSLGSLCTNLINLAPLFKK